MFRRGQTIDRVKGAIVHGLDKATPYCIALDEIRSLEPAAPLRFLNHSCEPNCEVFSWNEPGQRDIVYLRAVRTIRPDDELTIDYAWDADAAIRCRCGAKSCRGWIVEMEQLSKLLRTRNRQRTIKNRA